MLHHAEDAARLQGRIEGIEKRLLLPGHDPVMDIAEGEDHIGAFRRGDGHLVGRVEMTDGDLAVERRVVDHLLLEAVQVGGHEGIVGVGGEVGGVEPAVIPQIGGDDLGVPAS